MERQAPKGVVFDMDGVLVDSARLHARAWKEAFDHFLADLGRGDRFALPDDYRRHLDGRPRYQGVSRFLESRGIDLPAGEPSEPPGFGTEAALGNFKNEIFHRLLDEEPIRPLPGVEDFLDGLRASGTPMALVSSSRNTDRILPSAVERRVDVVLGGKDLDSLGIPGKPAPDMFLRASAELGMEATDMAIVEDSGAGVVAGRAGGFALVVGVDAGDEGSMVGDLADVAVANVAELPHHVSTWQELLTSPPPAHDHLQEIASRLEEGSGLYLSDDESVLLSARRAGDIGVMIDPEPSPMTWADYFVADDRSAEELRARTGSGQPAD